MAFCVGGWSVESALAWQLSNNWSWFSQSSLICFIIEVCGCVLLFGFCVDIELLRERDKFIWRSRDFYPPNACSVDRKTLKTKTTYCSGIWSNVVPATTTSTTSISSSGRAATKIDYLHKLLFRVIIWYLQTTRNWKPNCCCGHLNGVFRLVIIICFITFKWCREWVQEVRNGLLVVVQSKPNLQ